MTSNRTIEWFPRHERIMQCGNGKCYTVMSQSGFCGSVMKFSVTFNGLDNKNHLWRLSEVNGKPDKIIKTITSADWEKAHKELKQLAEVSK